MRHSLPLADLPLRQPGWRLYSVHLLRLTLVVSLLAAIPRPIVLRDGLEPPSIQQLIDAGHMIPDGCTIGARDLKSGLWLLEDSTGKKMGWIARSFPDAQKAIGYRGPTEASVLIDPDSKIVSVGVLSSEDTDEHVEAVKSDPAFLNQFQGWDWTIVPEMNFADGVSGATLTSLALAEGIMLRMGGEAPSLVFSNPLRLDDAKLGFPKAESISEESGEVYNRLGKVLGRVLRTGVLSDHLAGYQGPTELLLFLDPSGTIISTRIRESFDNEPYVDYVRTEYGFWKLFRGMNLKQLSELDLVAQGVEGVSGATMTSQNVAQTLVDAAKEYQVKALIPDITEPRLKIRWRWQDLSTMVLVIMAILMQKIRPSIMKKMRKFWLLLTILIIGFCAGNLLSMSLIAGWSAEGVAWRLAPGLAVIGAVAFLFPTLTRQNIYCNHLCPHGALQQLIKPTKMTHRMGFLRTRFPKWFTVVPGLLLLGAYTVLQLSPSVDLSKWEPFYAYLFQVSSWWVIGFAVMTILISRLVPMAYCRYGCPTGFLLGYLRLNAKSGYIQKADQVLLMVAVGTWTMKWIYS